MMDLSTEITQLKRIHSDLLDLLDQLVRKEMKLVQEKRALQSQKELLTRAPQPPRPVPTHPMWVRVNQICKTPSNPNGILPISRSTWFKGVKEETLSSEAFEHALYLGARLEATPSMAPCRV
ncbi:MAG: hypothetical protein EB072_20135 [Betaproteobacteria bacterium]|nr:hypothetical protein [Betaproteobacteria bacterium]